MDIKGAKALQQRLGQKKAVEASPPPEGVSADAPPVYHWTGVSQPAPAASQVDAEDEEDAPSMSLFRRLGLSFR